MKLSVIVPVMNEEQNVDPMIAALEKSLMQLDYEVIFIDDGSSDNTVSNILKHKGANIRLLQFARNYGQTYAIAAGIKKAVGDYIATIDGDLQNDPSDIPRMIHKLESEGLDIVTGIRASRQDKVLFRKIPSKIANWLIRKLSGVKIHDYGCSLKLFKNSIAKQLDLQGELHRFIPILADMNGAKIADMPVKHNQRQHGTSKYGLERTTKVLSDLILLLFFIKYKQKPMHFFGGMGFLLLSCGGIINIYLLIQKLLGYNIGDRPMFFVGILLIITAMQLITTGFLAEIMSRTYFATKDQSAYLIANEYQAGKKLSLL